MFVKIGILEWMSKEHITLPPFFPIYTFSFIIPYRVSGEIEIQQTLMSRARFVKFVFSLDYKNTESTE